MLQADRIEHPDYINKHGLKIDYLFYITNQIMNPCVQFFELLTDELPKIFKDIIDLENNINNKIYDQKAREKGFKILEKYGIRPSHSDNVNDNWEDNNLNINNILIDEKINQNIIQKEKKIKKSNTKKKKINILDHYNNSVSFEVEGF